MVLQFMQIEAIQTSSTQQMETGYTVLLYKKPVFTSVKWHSGLMSLISSIMGHFKSVCPNKRQLQMHQQKFILFVTVAHVKAEHEI